MYDTIEALRKGEARERNPLPPGTAQRYIDQMQSEFEFSGSPPGRSVSEGFTGDWTADFEPVRAPWRGEHDMPGNWERQQHMAHSLAEDAMLRESLGYQYKLPKGDETPEGTYTLARYPGVEHEIWAQESGFAPKGMMDRSVFMTPAERQEDMRKRKAWAKHQKKLLGIKDMDADEFRSFRRGMKGMGAKQRREAMRSYMRGI